MSISNDQQFNLQVTGTSDWDTALNSNFSKLERGFHFVERVGVNVNTGDVCRLASNGFMSPISCDPSRERVLGLALVSASSGDSVQFLHHGIVRSLAIFSLGNPGEQLFISPFTLGMVARSYSGAHFSAGKRLSGSGFMFMPEHFVPEYLSRVSTVAGVVGTNVDFTIDVGKRGWVRQLIAQGSSNLVSISFFSNSARTTRLYETISGGLTVVGSFLDQAGWPYENTDASTLNGNVYGRLRINSGSNITSGNIGITFNVDRIY